jgi:hypothetical protein
MLNNVLQFYNLMKKVIIREMSYYDHQLPGYENEPSLLLHIRRARPLVNRNRDRLRVCLTVKSPGVRYIQTSLVPCIYGGIGVAVTVQKGKIVKAVSFRRGVRRGGILTRNKVLRKVILNSVKIRNVNFIRSNRHVGKAKI